MSEYYYTAWLMKGKGELEGSRERTSGSCSITRGGDGRRQVQGAVVLVGLRIAF